MLKPRSSASLLLAILVTTGIGGYLVWHFAGSMAREIAADAPLEMPSSGAMDPRFIVPSAFEIARIPTATRFDPPLGTEHGALVYNAQPFWDMNDKRGGHHTGDDLNGIGGMNTDLGDPVFCVADGLVLYAADPSPGWGKMVIVAHRTTDGRILQSMYAHLYRIDVKRGQLIAREQKLGLVGTADGYYPAHLHFEMRDGDGVEIGPGYTNAKLDHLDPSATVNALRNAAPDELPPSPLGIANTIR